MSEYVLEMKNICKSFFGIKVLKNANLQVYSGEVHVLLGENGAGKSTLIKILSSAYKREQGEIFIGGKEVRFKSPKEAIDNGVSVIYQEFNLNPYVSIYENIFLGKEYMNHGFVDKKTAILEAEKYMKMIGLEVSPKTLVSELSVAGKQMVEIAKAIASDVKILILDEPTAAITEKEKEKLFEIIRKLKSEGVGIIYISHRMSELKEIGDRCTIMRDGEYVTTVNLADISMDELTALMVKRKICSERQEHDYVDEKYAMLDVRNLNYKDFLKDINFSIKKGEILGLAGLVGAGRTELAKCIIGAYKAKGAEIKVNGKILKGKGVSEAIKGKIVYLSEDRKEEGLITIHSINDNIALPNLWEYGKLFLDDKKIYKKTKEYMKRLSIKAASPKAEAKTLSGGNQQKVVIAKWLCLDADVYIFDEPTRGIDVGARDEIYEIMYDLAKKGSSILMISSDICEILKMSDRVGIMKEGKLVKMLKNTNSLTEDKVLSFALHGGEHYEE